MKRYIPAFLLAGALVCALAIAPSFRRNPLRVLERAGAQRPISARLWMDVQYRDCTPLSGWEDSLVRRETCGPGQEIPPDIGVLATSGESSDPDSLHLTAMAKLVWWDEIDASLDEVITRLETALRLSDDPLPLLVDLSGAHLARAERMQNSLDLFVALDRAGEALTYDSRNQPALFNFALSLELIAANEVAVRAWDAYLAVDHTSSWAEEARRRKAALTLRVAMSKPRPGASEAEVKAFTEHDPQRARLLGMDEVLGDWGRAVETGDTAAAVRYLALAEALGAALEQRGGDRSLADMVRAIHAAAGDAEATRLLAWTHRAYAVGQDHFEELETEAARDTFIRILRARPASPMLLEWTRVFHAGTMVILNHAAEAYPLLSALLSRVDSVRHPALAARIRWTGSTGLLRESKYPETRAMYQQVAQTFERLGEREFQGAMVGMEAEAAYGQGDTLYAYSSLHRVLLLLREHRGSVWRHNSLMELARYAAQDGMPSAATSIMEEVVANSKHSNLYKVRVEALVTRAEISAATGQISSAIHDIQAAKPMLEAINSKTTRTRLENALRYAEAVAGVNSDPTGSVAKLDSAVRHFSDQVPWLLPLLMLRADAHLASGNPAGAVTDLDTVTARIRSLSNKEPAAKSRAAMIEQARSRFDQLVMLHARAKQPIEALQVLERGRVSFSPDSQARVTVADRQILGPPGEVAVEYALVNDKLLIWTIRDSVVTLRMSTVDRDDFLRTIERVSATLELSREESAQEGLERLYDWLVRPVREDLGPKDTPLVILADGEIAGVPFQALFDRDRKRYLLDDHTIRFAASLADANRPAPPRSNAPALLVADPDFDAGEYSTLDPLRGARAEINSLRPLYPHHKDLERRDATRDAFMAWAPRASVIHYAGHAVFDDARPERSFLVLAGDSSSGRLTAESVSGMELDSVRLVVLSACRTVRSRHGRSGGFAGFSGAMLAAGAGGVVGSLWTVDDQLAQPLMLEFHRAYKRTHDPARALREAQLRLRNDPNPRLNSPAAWAGFRYAGR